MTDRDFGNRLSFTFSTQVKVYNSDPLVHESINQSAQQIISTGIFQDYNEEYTVKLPRPDGKGEWGVEDVVKKFNKDNDMDFVVLQLQLSYRLSVSAFGV
jgi:hypothetical protein